MALALDEALARLKVDPDHAVTAVVDGLVVEIRVRNEPTAEDIFSVVGEWEGESAEELRTLLEEARLQGGSKEPPAPF